MLVLSVTFAAELSLSLCARHLQKMGVAFRGLHAFACVWLAGGVGAFSGVGMPTLLKSRTQRIDICSSSSEQSGLAGNDAAQKALEQAVKLRQEAADLEKELAKGKPKVEDSDAQESSKPPLPDVTSSPFSLAPSRWLVMMDIGREKGTWMPQNWGISGRRVEVDLLVQFLPGGEMEASVDSPFVDMTVTPGRWSVGAAEGRNRRRRPTSLGSLTSDTCRFWVETEGFARGDVTIPAGKLYFAVPAWGGKLSRKGIVTVRQRRWLVREESRILGVFGTELLVPDAEGRLPPRLPRPRTPPFPDGFRNG